MEKIGTDKCLKKSRYILMFIFIYQMIALLGSFFLLYYINIIDKSQKEYLKILNSVLFGFSGSLIYFSRKSYVYLITSKFHKISLDEKSTNNNINSIFLGYYLYLLFRPFVGIIIGPVLYMLAMLGLVSFVKTQISVNPEFSKTGEYFIYLLSFFAGHACSDMFDYFSKIAKKIVVKNGQNGM